MDPTRYNDDQVEFMRRLGVDLDHMVVGSFHPVASGDGMGNTYSASWVEVGEWGRIDAERSTVAQTEFNGRDARCTVTHHAVLSPHQWSQWVTVSQQLDWSDITSLGQLVCSNLDEYVAFRKSVGDASGSREPAVIVAAVRAWPDYDVAAAACLNPFTPVGFLAHLCDIDVGNRGELGWCIVENPSVPNELLDRCWVQYQVFRIDHDFLPDYEPPVRTDLERVWLNRWVKSGRQADRD